ncbi:KRAB-A domain-containing protein 2-like [Metopolophium dirhodum]|uniref:KRAB-A domain-containing protein 2-like n=1 Tax=Metopolophium dirhodum TaxID=44670 RepID=UPI00299042EF|nr:KRAB-A domain-containing protein 2-like [Metopolophium dirhodum]
MRRFIGSFKAECAIRPLSNNVVAMPIPSDIFDNGDHLTKFVILRPLKTKRAEKIAFNLMDIYTIFGATAILHSDNGREFVNKIITELNEMWGDIKIVHGKPRHSQSQGSIERANRHVEDILATWMAENNSTDWPTALKFIQFQKNRAFHSGIGRSPYEAMFGCPQGRIGQSSFRENLEGPL